jgi:acyl carrier protein
MNLLKEESMEKKIEKIIIETLLELNEELEHPSLVNPNLKTKLYGTNAGLDSLALVSFITDLEEKISDEFDKEIVLADEKAMSVKTSPFRNVESLTLYIKTLLEN